jgi:hypothetical protein
VREVGERNGNVVVESVYRGEDGLLKIRCRCDCGNWRQIRSCHWRVTKSCGCTRRRSIVERFFEKTQPEPNSGCLLWTGAVHPDGYGKISPGGREGPKIASRVAWEIARGPIPDGMLVCHRCDTPACVNIDHLFLGTDADNVQDMVRKGRARNRPR